MQPCFCYVPFLAIFVCLQSGTRKSQIWNKYMISVHVHRNERSTKLRLREIPIPCAYFIGQLILRDTLTRLRTGLFSIISGCHEHVQGKGHATVCVSRICIVHGDSKTIIPPREDPATCKVYHYNDSTNEHIQKYHFDFKDSSIIAHYFL